MTTMWAYYALAMTMLLIGYLVLKAVVRKIVHREVESGTDQAQDPEAAPSEAQVGTDSSDSPDLYEEVPSAEEEEVAEFVRTTRGKRRNRRRKSQKLRAARQQSRTKVWYDRLG